MSDLTEDDLRVGRSHQRKRRVSVPIGATFGRLTVEQEIKRGKKTWFLCQCICGNRTTVQMNNLRPGGTKSCGCAIGRHGMNRRGKRTLTYSSWSHMITRCTNANYHAFPRYGGRGVSVHPEWMTFENFLADMGECPTGMTIDRIDNNGNYEPGNCRWTAQKTQNRNTSRVQWVVLEGETVCFADAATKLGVPAKTMESWRRAKGITHQATVDHYAEQKRSL